MADGVVCVLGPIRFVDGDGKVIELPSVALRRLLAVLAVSPDGTLRGEYLCDLLDLSPGALRTSLSRLRSRIGDQVIRTEPTGYRLTCENDARAFTSLLGDRCHADPLVPLDEALALWHGDAIEEFRHEPWAEADAARLTELRCVAIERRSELLIERGRCGEAVAVLQAHVAAHPLRDRPRGLVMEALAGDGRQADALRAFHHYRDFLAHETGTEPSPEVQSIERRIAAGWLDGEGRPLATPLPAEGQARDRPRVEIPLAGAIAHGAPLVGRTRELAALEAELALARSGALRVVRLSGDAGIGKTTLLASFARAPRGSSAAVLYGRCDETSVPLQPFRSIVRAVVEHAPLELLRDHAELHGGELARLAPHLRARTWVPAPVHADDAIERFHLFEAIADVLRRLAAARPVALVLDDLHWAEPTALLLLRHLVRSLVDSPVLVVASHRGHGERLPPDLRVALADLGTAPVRRLELTGLDDGELADLISSLLETDAAPDPEAIASLRNQTDGNPLYASQLLLHLRESGSRAILGARSPAVPTDPDLVPPGLVDVVWQRVHELGPGATEVLRAGSVLAPEASRDLIGAVLGLTGDQLDSSLRPALASGLLREGGQGARTLRFTHALVAQALYGELPADERRLLHGHALRVLTAVEAPGPSAVVQLARHAAGADDHVAAVRWASEAGRLALDNLAPIEATRWYRAALDHAAAAGSPNADRAALEVRLGSAQLRAGDPSSRATLLAAADLAQQCAAHDVLIDAALAHDRGFMRIGAPDDEMLSTIEAALHVVDPADEASSARLLALYAQQLVPTTRIDLRTRVAHEAVELIERSGDPLLLPQVISGLLFALWGPGTLELRRTLAVRASEAADRSDDLLLQFWTSRAAYFAAVESADPGLARAQRDRLRAIVEAVPEPRLRWICTIADAFEATMEARLGDAEALIDQSLELGLQLGEPDAVSLYAGQLFSCRSFAGRYEELIPLIEQVKDANPGVRAFELAHAIACAVVGQVDEPRRMLFEAAASDFADVPVDYLWMTSIIGYAVLAIELEATTAAAPLYALLAPYGDQVAFSGVSSQGHIAAYLGKLASLLGDHVAADEHLHRSLDVARAFGWRYHEATTLVAMALSHWRRTGALDGNALDWLESAEAIGLERELPIVLSQAADVRVRASAELHSCRPGVHPGGGSG